MIPDYLKQTTMQPPVDNVQANESGLASGEMVKNNGFFPDLSINEFDTDYVTDASVSNERRLNALEHAVIHTNDELNERWCKWSNAGYPTLHNVPQSEVNGVGDLLVTYRQAVFSRAMMLLNNTYRSSDTTRHEVMTRGDELEESASSYAMNYRLAINKLLGKPAQTVYVELI